MKHYLSSCLLALMLFAAGCYKDKGNYDLHDINQIAISSSTRDTIRLQLFDRLKIDIDVQQSAGKDESGLEFSWRMFEVNGPAIRLAKTKISIRS